MASKTKAERIAHAVETYGVSEALATAKINYEDECSAVSDMESVIEAEIRAATAAIRDKHRAALNIARDQWSAALGELDDLKIMESNRDNRIGMKVSKKVRKDRSLWSRSEAMETIYGIMEVRSPETRFPDNMRYLPSMGSKFVRLMKKDGTVGMRIDERFTNWTVVED